MVYPLLGLINHKEKNKELLIILKLLQWKKKRKKKLCWRKNSPLLNFSFCVYCRSPSFFWSEYFIWVLFDVAEGCNPPAGHRRLMVGIRPWRVSHCGPKVTRPSARSRSALQKHCLAAFGTSWWPEESGTGGWKAWGGRFVHRARYSFVKSTWNFLSLIVSGTFTQIYISFMWPWIYKD